LFSKRFIKNKYPILVALAFLIYISTAAFIIVFAANAGPAMAHNGGTVDSLPNVTGLNLETDFTSVDIDNERLYTGPLVLVNNYYSCRFDGDDLVSVLDNGSSKYTASDYDVKVNKSIMKSLDNMLSDFYDRTNNKNIMVSSAYRSKELQQELYNEEHTGDNSSSDSSGEELVAKPGYSEHQTGYAVDFSLLDEEGNISVFDNEGDYSWILENCANYGFILRYPENKTDITEIGYETWHYRYVGTPHASYIMQNDLCLEEYIELLKNYPITNPLYISDYALGNWMVYFVPSEGGSQTSVTVPKNSDYQVYGNNNDGFIISVQLS